MWWLGVTLLAAMSTAAPSGVELQWASVVGCPDRVQLQPRLDALVGSTAQGRAAGRLDLHEDAYRLRLEITAAGRSEQRELRAQDCELLAEAGLLVVAVTVDALATSASVTEVERVPLGETPPPPSPGPEVAPPRQSVAPTMPRPQPRPIAPADTPLPADTPTPKRVRLSLGASGGVATGQVPGVTGGLAGDLDLRLGPVLLRAGGFHWFGRRALLRPDAGVEAALSGASLRGCMVFDRARVEAPLCTGLDLAAMHGGGTGAAVIRRDAIDLWIGVAAGAGLTVWLTHRFALGARAEGTMALRRPAMVLDVAGTPQEVFRLPFVGTRVLAGPIVRLW